MIRVGWEQVFAWRLRRQFVAPRSVDGAAAVTRRLCGVQAQVASTAELAVGVRRQNPERDAVGRALAAGELIKTWAMRGTLHVMTPDLAAACLGLVGAARTWEKPVWQRNFGVSPAQVATLADRVGHLLDTAVLTRAELVAELVTEPELAPLAEHLSSGWGTLLKPLAWQGVLCHGPMRGSAITFTTPARAVPDWPGLPEPDRAAALVIPAYLSAYGPATPETFDAWLTRGAHRKATVRRWFADLGDELVEVEVEGRRGHLYRADVDELLDTAPVTSVHLLGGFDQYVLGPGTGDTALLPAAHRRSVSRTAGWIAPLVVVGGRIAGTWELLDGAVVVDMFDGAPLPRAGLDEAVARLSAALGQPGLGLRTAA